MCDATALHVLLGAALTCIVAAIVAVAVAAALNGGFFSAPGAPIPMGIAGGLTAGAIGSLTAARVLVEDFFRCMGSLPECQAHYDNYLGVIGALLTVLTIQMVSCFAVAAVAWIPWAAQPAMGVILGAFIVQLGVVPSLTVFWVQLESCLRHEAAVRAIYPLLAATIPFVVVGLGVAYYLRRGSLPRTRPPTLPPVLPPTPTLPDDRGGELRR